jgi:tetratricopeptide (TPR) repeat protein
MSSKTAMPRSTHAVTASRRLIPTVSLALFLLLGPNVAIAMQQSPWLGKKVVTKYAKPLRVPEGIVDDGTTFRVYTVEAVNGDWLWLVRLEVKGWVRTRDVVRSDQAIDFYNQEIRANPGNAAAYIWRGMIFNEFQSPDNAIADSNEAIRLNPDDATAYNTRGVAWNSKAEYESAIADYNQAIRINPRHVPALANRAAAWSRRRDYDRAIADFTQVMRYDPKNSLIFHGRGNALAAKNDHQKALADYNEAIRLDPKNAAALNHRAWLLATCPDEKVRDGKQAVESATRACELSDWKNADYVATLAAAYAEMGDFAKAAKWQGKSNALYDDTAAQKRGQVRLKLYKTKTPYRDNAREFDPAPSVGPRGGTTGS